jgi:hypothetical protein
MAVRPVGKKMQLSVLFDTVTIDIIFNSEYEAQVFYDDIAERALSGDGFSLTVPKDEHGRIH